MNLEEMLLWQIYAAAMVAWKSRKYARLARDRYWQADLREVQQYLGTLGMTL